MSKIITKLAEIEKIINKFGPRVTQLLEVGRNVIEIGFKRNLTLSERSKFVNMVVDGTFSGGEYHPEYKKPLKSAAFYALFTDLPIPYENDSTNIDLDKIIQIIDVFDLENGCLYRSENLNSTMADYDNLCSVADEKIELRLKSALANNSPAS